MLNRTAYVQLLATMGEAVRWFKALPTYDAAHIADSTATVGKRWVEQAVPLRTKVLAREQKDEYEHPDFGLIHVGDLIVTMLDDQIAVVFQDIFVFPGRTEVTREAVTRGTGTTDALLQEYPVRLVAVSDAARTYRNGPDYTLDTAQEVAWTVGGTAPTAGDVYTVEYTYNPVYWYMSGKERAARPIPMASGNTPQQVVLTKRLPGDA
jgi:hypothetical protein